MPALVLLIIFLWCCRRRSVGESARFLPVRHSRVRKTVLSVGESDNTMFIGNHPVTG
ncbi:hypothetical protein KCP74_09485 [Salmonella enterica subsp. enterica]|nr:hypothetical protein KCP74_09485 [Salmonella enterica subsp. enterica]